jgi:hypothetical protein
MFVRSPDLHQLFASTDSSRPLTGKSRKSVVVARIAGIFNEYIGLFRSTQKRRSTALKLAG